MDEITCHYIDRLMTIEMRAGKGEIPRGVIYKLYDAARSAQSDKPLTWLAAEGLRRSLSAGDHVLIVTGAGSAPWLPFGETDGPLGAAAMARSLDLALGVKSILVSEHRNMAPVIAAVEGIGLLHLPREQFDKRSSGAFMSLPMPLGAAEGDVFTHDVFETYRPKAVIFIEKGGPNAEGFYNSLLGTGRTTDMMANAEKLAIRAKKFGVFTLGIGDGGNEIGFGKVAEAVRDIQPFGRISKRPDGSVGVGIATVAETDVLVAAAVSNWGAYAVCAALASLEGRADILHSPADEARMMQRCIAAGAVDGIFCTPVPCADGTSEATQSAVITMLQDIVVSSLRTVRRGF